MKQRPGNMPEIVEKDEAEIQQIIATIRASALPEDIKTFVIKCIELALWLPLFLAKKNATLHRFRTMIFGKGYRKSNKNNEKNEGAESIPSSDEDEVPDLQNKTDLANSADGEPVYLPADIGSADDENEKKTGHGRMPHTVYKNCTEIQLLHSLASGDDCPTLCGGKLSSYKPGVIVRIKGQNFAEIYRYHVEKLRCNLCGIIIGADTPEEVGTAKYDESFIAMLALMKYYIAIPFYRQENFQRMLGFPLPDSTQWDLMEKLAGYCFAPFNALKYCAANGNVIQNDDTKLRILEVIKQIKNGTAGDRSGMYTTGIIAVYEGHQVALFINGRQHSGENVADILRLREPDKNPIIQMCDALSANIPKPMRTILCNCLSHGFRKFDELVDFFEQECLIIMTKLSKVFDYDLETRNMSDQERLVYHQKHCRPIMDELKQYMSALLADHLVEPNSELGKSIRYMLKRWDAFTRFLTVAGAPIDNNIVERALKIAIRNRKSALFYKTVYSAGIGGMLTSLIYTCHLNNQNPHDYLVALQVHQSKVIQQPEQWLPWNYLNTIAQLTSDANVQVPPPLMDHLVAA